MPIKEPTGMDIIRGLETMLKREPTREEILVALGVPMAYKDAPLVTESHIVPYLNGRAIHPICNLVSPTSQDSVLGEMLACFTQWHLDRNLVAGATDAT